MTIFQSEKFQTPFCDAILVPAEEKAEAYDNLILVLKQLFPNSVKPLFLEGTHSRNSK